MTAWMGDEGEQRPPGVVVEGDSGNVIDMLHYIQDAMAGSERENEDRECEGESGK